MHGRGCTGAVQYFWILFFKLGAVNCAYWAWGVQNRAKNRKLNSPVPAREGCCFLKCQLISTSRRVVSFRSRGFRCCTSCFEKQEFKSGLPCTLNILLNTIVTQFRPIHEPTCHGGFRRVKIRRCALWVMQCALWVMQCALWVMQNTSYQQCAARYGKCSARVINNALRAMDNAHPHRELIDLPQVTFQIRS